MRMPRLESRGMAARSPAVAGLLRYWQRTSGVIGDHVHCESFIAS
jgi:hypothetical protein